MQLKMRRVLAAVLCAALAAVTLAACGKKKNDTGGGASPTATPRPSASPAGSALPDGTAAEPLWLAVMQEGEELTAAATRYFRELGADMGVAVNYPHESFLPDEEAEGGVVIRGNLPATGPECGLTVTALDGDREAAAQRLMEEHPLTRQEDAAVGAARLPALHLTGTETSGEAPLAVEYYLVEQGGRTWAVQLYYAPDQAESVRPWLQAMLDTVEFTAR